MAALAERSANSQAAGAAPTSDACASRAGAAAAAAGSEDMPLSAPRYPHSLLELRQERMFTTDDFDIAPKPLGQGKFGK
jgi:hypothetical protein